MKMNEVRARRISKKHDTVLDMWFSLDRSLARSRYSRAQFPQEDMFESIRFSETLFRIWLFLFHLGWCATGELLFSLVFDENKEKLHECLSHQHMSTHIHVEKKKQSTQQTRNPIGNYVRSFYERLTQGAEKWRANQPHNTVKTQCS